MLRPTHRAFATTLTTGVLVINNYTHIIDIKPIDQGLILAVAWVTASLPDIDMVFKRLPIYITHRGITHTIWSVICLGILCYVYPNWFTYGLFCGWTSHLIGDAYSKAGIAWFYPIQQYRRYPSGAMFTLNRSKIFPPLYKVGVKVGPLQAKYYWYTITMLLWLFYFCHHTLTY